MWAIAHVVIGYAHREKKYDIFNGDGHVCAVWSFAYICTYIYIYICNSYERRLAFEILIPCCALKHVCLKCEVWMKCMLS